MSQNQQTKYCPITTDPSSKTPTFWIVGREGSYWEGSPQERSQHIEQKVSCACTFCHYCIACGERSIWPCDATDGSEQSGWMTQCPIRCCWSCQCFSLSLYQARLPHSVMERSLPFATLQQQHPQPLRASKKYANRFRWIARVRRRQRTQHCRGSLAGRACDQWCWSAPPAASSGVPRDFLRQ